MLQWNRMNEPMDKVHRPLQQMLWQNFLGGVAWALGVTLGLTVVVTLVGFLLAQLDFVPIVGDLATGIVQFVEENKKTPQSIAPIER